MLKFRPMTCPVRLPIARHPIFRLERRRVRWSVGIADYLSLTWRWAGLSCLLIVASAWIIASFFSRNSTVPYGRPWEGNILMLAFGIVSLAGLLIDFLCLVLAGSAISSEIVAGRWTLLRLTTLSSKSIVSAKHASVRLRYWPWLHVLAGMRCGVVVLLALWNLDTLRYSSALDVFLIIGLFILAAVPYVIEPFWRTQAMTSVGLFFSALNRSTALTVLTAVFGLFALWLVQAVIVGSVLFIELRAWISLYDNLPEVRSMWPTFIFTSLLIISFWLLNYSFYDQLERRSRRRILRRLAMSDV